MFTPSLLVCALGYLLTADVSYLPEAPVNEPKCCSPAEILDLPNLAGCTGDCFTNDTKIKFLYNCAAWGDVEPAARVGGGCHLSSGMLTCAEVTCTEQEYPMFRCALHLCAQGQVKCVWEYDGNDVISYTDCYGNHCVGGGPVSNPCP